MSNPTAYTHLQQHSETGQFQRIFICPAESDLSFSFCRPFIAIDGTFIKTRFQKILLLVVTLNANNHILVLAWYIVESKNADSWTYFISHLVATIPVLSARPSTFISDRDKGLIDAEAPLLPPNICRTYCCFYLKRRISQQSSVIH